MKEGEKEGEKKEDEKKEKEKRKRRSRMTRNKEERKRKEDEKEGGREGGREEGARKEGGQRRRTRRRKAESKARYGENQSVYPIHTNFTILEVYSKSLTQYWAMANRLGAYTMTCYSERDPQSSKERGE